MKTATFYSYLPKRYTANDAHTERVRRFIYSFKRGDRHAVDFAINIVSESYGYYVSTDPDFFAGKNVILFDDLITTGATAEEFAAELAAVDANVIGGLFLSRTKLMNNH